MEASACGQCLSDLFKTFSANCIFDAITPDCEGDNACKPYADCEGNCLD
jgi:hypothetical protein